MNASTFFNDRGIHQNARNEQPAEDADNKCPRCDRGRLGKNSVCGNCWHRVKAKESIASEEEYRQWLISRYSEPESDLERARR